MCFGVRAGMRCADTDEMHDTEVRVYFVLVAVCKHFIILQVFQNPEIAAGNVGAHCMYSTIDNCNV